MWEHLFDSYARRRRGERTAFHDPLQKSFGAWPLARWMLGGLMLVVFLPTGGCQLMKARAYSRRGERVAGEVTAMYVQEHYGRRFGQRRRPVQVVTFRDTANKVRRIYLHEDPPTVAVGDEHAVVFLPESPDKAYSADSLWIGYAPAWIMLGLAALGAVVAAANRRAAAAKTARRK